MIEKKIKALRDITLNTYIESHFLIKDEVKIIKFRNQRRFENLLKLGNFVEADRSEEEVRNIPVIQASTSNTEEDEQELPFVEPIQDHNDLDEVHKLVEVEEIPIEEQDKSKPELQLDEVVDDRSEE